MKLIKKLLWLKTYFDKGYGITSYLKWLIAIFGATSTDIKLTMLLMIGWGLSCFVIGWVWVKYKLVDIENDIQNSLNPFVREVRRKL